MRRRERGERRRGERKRLVLVRVNIAEMQKKKMGSMIQYLCQLQSTNLEASIGISIDYTNLQSYAKKHPDFVLSAKAKYFNTFTLISLGDSRGMLIQFFWWEVLTAWNTVLVGNVERNEWCSRDSFQIEWM